MKTEEQMCMDCGGFCCHSTFMSLPKNQIGSKRWKFLTVRSTGWVEFGDKKDRWFILPQPCPKFKDGLCTIHETKPVCCREYPEPQRPQVWETKCEVLRNRRKL